MNWNDLSYLIALAENRTLLSAAKVMGVTHTTVARRLQVLEQSLGTRLFDRIEGQFTLTVAGEIALEHAMQIEKTTLSLYRTIGNQDEALAGSIRITALNSFINKFLVNHINLFCQRYPKIQLELIGSSNNLNLSHREADIAIRMARPQSGTMVIRKLCSVGFSVYASREHFPVNCRPLNELPWVIYDESYQHLPEFKAIEQWLKNKPWIISATDTLNLLELIQQGVGVGILPCYIADNCADIYRLTGPEPIVSRELWLLTHRDLRSVAKIRGFMDWLVATVEQYNSTFEGYI